jgi:hypothetical protein
MADDEYSEFSQWAHKKRVKKASLDRRRFIMAFSQVVEDLCLTNDEIAKYDDRDYFYKVLHARLDTNAREENA